ncbi:hypothetical protein PGTUg99_010745 [Puccinia graminis f. sp. tritici]|uniref:Uncharacterized protein n=1 Tax=Puccinia graminis f. sp. tritici TaxID=56615 RepID=A0A5B0MHF8_PUCGR|nr:hypothetical protein PGTUg99_010745 [Puccinia graminis f. sp. tritici]
MCKAPACIPASLTAAGQKFKTGCAAEMSSGSMDAGAFYSLLTTYKTLRSEACPNVQKLDFCEPALAGHIKKWTQRERPFFSVPRAAYCTECGSKSPANQPGKNGTNHAPCRDAGTPNPSVGMFGKPVVVALPAPNASSASKPAPNPSPAAKPAANGPPSAPPAKAPKSG